MIFQDRVDAGRQLAARLLPLRGEDPVVLGLPRGGVIVAAEVARALAAPLDVICVRKLGVPSQPEFGLGAIGEGGIRVINSEVVQIAQVTADQIAVVEERERAELTRRAWRYRQGRPRAVLADRTAVVVDDGMATGATARAACQVVWAHGARRVVLAVPVASPVAAAALAGEAGQVIWLAQPEGFHAVGECYEDFSQTSDGEVLGALQAAWAAPGPA